MIQTISATQKLTYKIPMFPGNVQTTTGQTLLIQDLSGESITNIFEAMKENALEFRRSKIEIPTKLESPENKIASAAGKVLANKIG